MIIPASTATVRSAKTVRPKIMSHVPTSSRGSFSSSVAFVAFGSVSTYDVFNEIDEPFALPMLFMPPILSHIIRPANKGAML